MKIDWDEIKNLANQTKHGVSFEEASALFSSGVDYLEIFDEAHSDEEERFIAIGPIRRGLVLSPGRNARKTRCGSLGAAQQ